MESRIRNNADAVKDVACLGKIWWLYPPKRPDEKVKQGIIIHMEGYSNSGGGHCIKYGTVCRKESINNTYIN